MEPTRNSPSPPSPPPLEPDARLEAEIRGLGPWFHNMRLAGIATAPDHPLGDYPAEKWRRFQHLLADAVSGASVLDIGCNAGFHALEAKRMGASYVLGIDHDARYLAQARLAADVAGLDIDLQDLSVYDVGRLGRRFDVVLFMGVLYHLRHPLLALDLISEHVVGGLLVFQSMLRGSASVAPVNANYDFFEQAHFVRPDYPKLHFIEHAYAGDPSNWWVPNRACAEAMLRSASFEIVAHPEPEVFLCRPAPTRVWGSAAVYPDRGAS